MTTYRELEPEEQVAWRKRAIDFATRSTESANREIPDEREALEDAMDDAGELLMEGLDLLLALEAAYRPSVDA